MSVRSRIARLERAAGGTTLPAQVEFVVCVPVGCPAAEGRPAGEYPGAGGRVVEVVYAGPAPDSALLVGYRARMPGWGRIVVSHPDEAGSPNLAPAHRAAAVRP